MKSSEMFAVDDIFVKESIKLSSLMTGSVEFIKFVLFAACLFWLKFK